MFVLNELPSLYDKTAKKQYENKFGRCGPLALQDFHGGLKAEAGKFRFARDCLCGSFVPQGDDGVNFGGVHGGI